MHPARLIAAVVTAGAIACGLAGCDTGPTGSAGFSLPEGDPVQGAVEFSNLHCDSCHSVEGIDYSGEPGRDIPLGGETTHIKTYGELVTAIINPSHRVSRARLPGARRPPGQSPMVNYNDLMTVSQLVDLVAFVQSTYTLSEYARSHYPIYYVEKPQQRP
jgi:mono/diheme cytochrome c family protein